MIEFVVGVLLAAATVWFVLQPRWETTTAVRRSVVKNETWGRSTEAKRSAPKL